jgi:hypothetical protein
LVFKRQYREVKIPCRCRPAIVRTVHSCRLFRKPDKPNGAGFSKRNVLAFSRLATSQKYLEYNDEVLHGNTSLRIAEVQKKMPAGQPFVAWVSTPFYLDFRRNFIFDVDISGIGSPWAFIPGEAEYFMVEYAGYGVFPVNRYYEFLQDPGRKQSAELILNFMQTTRQLSQNADMLFDDGKIVVFKIKK